MTHPLNDARYTYLIAKAAYDAANEKAEAESAPLWQHLSDDEFLARQDELEKQDAAIHERHHVSAFRKALTDAENLLLDQTRDMIAELAPQFGMAGDIETLQRTIDTGRKHWKYRQQILDLTVRIDTETIPS